MTKQALNEWAVMNLSMEDRGLKALEPEPAARGQQPTTASASFLTGDLSHFGVCKAQNLSFLHNPICVYAPCHVVMMHRDTLHKASKCPQLPLAPSLGTFHTFSLHSAVRATKHQQRTRLLCWQHIHEKAADCRQGSPTIDLSGCQSVTCSGILYCL